MVSFFQRGNSYINGDNCEISCYIWNETCSGYLWTNNFFLKCRFCLSRSGVGPESLHFFFLIYLFMAVSGLRFYARAFSSCVKWGPLFIAVRGPLTIAASLVAEHRLQTRRLSNCGSRAQLLRGMWDPPRAGLEPVSPALAGRFSTTAPPGKPWTNNFLTGRKVF